MAPEEEGPMVEHRSLFPDVHVLKDPSYKLTQRGRQTLAEANIELPAVLRFEGGDVPLPKPTRAELILSAQQWSKALRDHAVDWNSHNDKARGMFDRLDAVLAELAVT